MRQLIGKLLSGACIERPAFIVGSGRSGTSVLLQSLGRHPEVLAAPGEAPLLTSIGGMVALYEFDADHDYFERSLRIPKSVLNAKLRQTAFEIACGPHLGLGLLLRKLRESPLPIRKRIWMAKTFPPEIVTQGLQSLYPEMKLLYIVRNGLEVVQSRTKFHGFRDNEFQQHCDAWSHGVEKYRYLMARDNAMMVRHEQLVASPRTQMKRIQAFLDLADHEDPANFLQMSMIHPLDESSRDSTDVQQEFLRRRPAHENWPPENRHIFKNTCGRAMEDLGYEIPF